jgi:hypothetical protein
MKGKTSSL